MAKTNIRRKAARRINDVFATDYSVEEAIAKFPNEHHTPAGEIITDTYFSIRKEMYQIECQSNPDGTMG